MKTLVLAVSGLLLGGLSAQADVYSLDYSFGPTNTGAIIFATGLTAYGDGYFPITGIIGDTLEGGPITGLTGPAVDPTTPTNNGAFLFNNAFSPTGAPSGNPFDDNGLLFNVANTGDVAIGPPAEINLFGDGAGNLYEYYYPLAITGPPSYGGATLTGHYVLLDIGPGASVAGYSVVPEPGVDGMLVLGLAGLAFAIRRRKIA
ncbi:MAG: PEP-CTERM sorting domain-containing protein [Bryobacteraceae bacterium]